jgi:RecA-family ATPase
MVEGCFAKGTVGMVSGDGGIGKSLLLQQLATVAAIGAPGGGGRKWLGLDVRPGRVLFLGCEDDEPEMVRRQADINRHYGCEFGDLDEDLLLLPRVAQDNTLLEFENYTRKPKPTEFFNRIWARAAQFGAQYVIVDTATQTFRGNQLVELDVVAYISLLRRLAIKLQGVVIFTKHPSNTGRALGTGESGSVAWNNSVRSRLYLHEDKDGLQLAGMKSNYGPKLKALPLEWRQGVYVRPDDVSPPWWAR